MANPNQDIDARFKTIPADRQKRNPLITPHGYKRLMDITQHPQAPKWNYVVGDRIEKQDIKLLDETRRAVFKDRLESNDIPPAPILEWIGKKREHVWLFQSHLPQGFDLERDWLYVPTMSREDLATRIEEVVPFDSDLSRLIVYDTSGTTGHAIVIPYHPQTLAQNHGLVEFVLSRYGIYPEFGPDMVSCLNVGGHNTTVVFPNVFSIWNQAGFAKVNLNRNDWNSKEQAQKFFTEMKPSFLTGEPLGFAEMINWNLEIRTAAMVSTSVTLSDDLKKALEAKYRCPIIDWYSLTETGPIAYSCPEGHGMHIIPTDIFVEVLDDEGDPVSPGEIGDITVTGGRNPYVPLLRYKTGDHGGIDRSPCSCGDPTPRIIDFQGREIVLYRADDDSIVNPVDVGKIMRLHPFLQHEFIQRADGSCDLSIRPAKNAPVDKEGLIKELVRIFGKKTQIRIHMDPNLGQGVPGRKVFPYRSELPALSRV